MPFLAAHTCLIVWQALIKGKCSAHGSIIPSYEFWARRGQSRCVTRSFVFVPCLRRLHWRRYWTYDINSSFIKTCCNVNIFCSLHTFCSVALRIGSSKCRKEPISRNDCFRLIRIKSNVPATCIPPFFNKLITRDNDIPMISINYTVAMVIDRLKTVSWHIYNSGTHKIRIFFSLLSQY